MYRRVGRILFARPQERGGGKTEERGVHGRGKKSKRVRGKHPQVRNVSLCCGGICLRKYRLDRRRGGEGLERADGWKQGECACGGEREEEEGRRGGGGSE